MTLPTAHDDAGWDALAGDERALHRYSNLRWYLVRLPAGDATTLEQLAVRWWPLH
jgi:hypothetical protein